MSTDYLMVHTTYKSLSDEAKSLTDRYFMREITEAEFVEVLLAWDETCPNLLYENGNKSALASSLVRYIGKRRATTILAMLKAGRRQ